MLVCYITFSLLVKVATFLVIYFVHLQNSQFFVDLQHKHRLSQLCCSGSCICPELKICSALYSCHTKPTVHWL